MTFMPETKYTNRLIHESSPYLLQHAHNPVDWYPWGDEAFTKAKTDNKPILLSIGYSACHWCHVMERESFADPETAQLMNANFIPVKVDREERPDIDQLYQNAAQAMHVHGGWPLTVFLTPDGKPFYAGTYFPPFPSYGRPGFKQVLAAIADAWRERARELCQNGDLLTQALSGGFARAGTEEGELPDEKLIADAVENMVRRTDPKYGGFDGAPKFPSVSNLLLMLRHGKLHQKEEPVRLALFTLRQMARGGIYDQLGGGFHRYSTDNRWLVPHFEKMLYDNAQLLEAYSIAYQLTGEDFFARILRETADYVEREMTDAQGGFYATQDADSEGVEGKFFVWSTEEVAALLTEQEYATVKAIYGLTEGGNFAGRNILHIAEDPAALAARTGRPLADVEGELASARRKLFAAREKRVKPFRDEKIILGWNGLMISGLAKAGQALAEEKPLNLARRAAEFALGAMAADETHMYRIYKDGQAKIPAFLEDYAYFISSLIDLYESDFNPRWLSAALALQATVLQEFKAQDNRYNLSSNAGPQLVATPVSGFDQAIPSGAAVHLHNLLRLHHFTGNAEYANEARLTLTAYREEISDYPMGYGAMISALEMLCRQPTVLVIFCPEGWKDDLLQKVYRKFLPYRVIAGHSGTDSVPENHPAAHLLSGRETVKGQTTFYVCSGFVCHPPKTDWSEVENLLNPG